MLRTLILGCLLGVFSIYPALASTWTQEQVDSSWPPPSLEQLEGWARTAYEAKFVSLNPHLNGPRNIKVVVEFKESKDNCLIYKVDVLGWDKDREPGVTPYSVEFTFCDE